MKKVLILKLDDEDYGHISPKYFDVSDSKLLDEARKWIFYNTDIQDIMDNKIYDYNEDCKYCDNTGKVELKENKFCCPSCKGFVKDKNFEKIIKIYNKALDGDIKSIKYILNAVGFGGAQGKYSEYVWYVEKITKV